MTADETSMNVFDSRRNTIVNLKQVSESPLRNALETFDKNGDGKIDISELQKIMYWYGLWKYASFGLCLIIMTLVWSTFGLTIWAINLMKDYTVTDGVLTGGGEVVKMSVASTYIPLSWATLLDRRHLDSLESLTIDVTQGSGKFSAGVYHMKVASYLHANSTHLKLFGEDGSRVWVNSGTVVLHHPSADEAVMVCGAAACNTLAVDVKPEYLEQLVQRSTALISSNQDFELPSAVDGVAISKAAGENATCMAMIGGYKDIFELMNSMTASDGRQSFQSTTFFHFEMKNRGGSGGPVLINDGTTAIVPGSPARFMGMVEDAKRESEKLEVNLKGGSNYEIPSAHGPVLIDQDSGSTSLDPIVNSYLSHEKPVLLTHVADDSVISMPQFATSHRRLLSDFTAKVNGLKEGFEINPVMNFQNVEKKASAFAPSSIAVENYPELSPKLHDTITGFRNEMPNSEAVTVSMVGPLMQPKIADAERRRLAGGLSLANGIVEKVNDVEANANDNARNAKDLMELAASELKSGVPSKLDGFLSFENQASGLGMPTHVAFAAGGLGFPQADVTVHRRLEDFTTLVDNAKTTTLTNLNELPKLGEQIAKPAAVAFMDSGVPSNIGNLITSFDDLASGADEEAEAPARRRLQSLNGAVENLKNRFQIGLHAIEEIDDETKGSINELKPVVSAALHDAITSFKNEAPPARRRLELADTVNLVEGAEAGLNGGTGIEYIDDATSQFTKIVYPGISSEFNSLVTSFSDQESTPEATASDLANQGAPLPAWYQTTPETRRRLVGMDSFNNFAGKAADVGSGLHERVIRSTISHPDFKQAYESDGAPADIVGNFVGMMRSPSTRRRLVNFDDFKSGVETLKDEADLRLDASIQQLDGNTDGYIVDTDNVGASEIDGLVNNFADRASELVGDNDLENQLPANLDVIPELNRRRMLKDDVKGIEGLSWMNPDAIDSPIPESYQPVAPLPAAAGRVQDGLLETFEGFKPNLPSSRRRLMNEKLVEGGSVAKFSLKDNGIHAPIITKFGQDALQQIPAAADSAAAGTFEGFHLPNRRLQAGLRSFANDVMGISVNDDENGAHIAIPGYGQPAVTLTVPSSSAQTAAVVGSFEDLRAQIEAAAETRRRLQLDGLNDGVKGLTALNFLNDDPNAASHTRPNADQPAVAFAVPAENTRPDVVASFEQYMPNLAADGITRRLQKEDTDLALKRLSESDLNLVQNDIHVTRPEFEHEVQASIDKLGNAPADTEEVWESFQKEIGASAPASDIDLPVYELPVMAGPGPVETRRLQGVEGLMNTDIMSLGHLGYDAIAQQVGQNIQAIQAGNAPAGVVPNFEVMMPELPAISGPGRRRLEAVKDVKATDITGFGHLGYKLREAAQNSGLSDLDDGSDGGASRAFEVFKNVVSGDRRRLMHKASFMGFNKMGFHGVSPQDVQNFQTLDDGSEPLDVAKTFEKLMHQSGSRRLMTTEEFEKAFGQLGTTGKFGTNTHGFDMEKDNEAQNAVVGQAVGGAPAKLNKNVLKPGVQQWTG